MHGSKAPARPGGISLDRDPQRWQMIIASSINPETIDQTTDAYIPRSRRGVGLEPPMTANDGKAFDSDTGGLNITIERKKETSPSGWGMEGPLQPR